MRTFKSFIIEGRPSQRHPLEGHEYHKKTDAELKHIAKDAHEAAEAMKGHNTQAENKYRDQANDSATVRHYRKTHGMADWYKKKYGHVKEDFVAESQTSKTGIVETDVYGSKAYHAKCLEPGCKFESKRYDRIKQAQDAAQKHAKQHFEKNVKEDIEQVDERCWPGYKPAPGKKAYDKGSCIKEEVELDEDWQKVNKADKTDGLSQKAVNAYRRENPGSKLQTAVTEKNPTGKRAKRRLSFCRRMGGMKKRLTNPENARDPDSPINKALRRWNC